MPSIRQNPTRAGNAILAAVLIMALVAAAISVSIDQGTASFRRVQVENTESRVLAALDTVLARRQQDVIYKVTNQRPEDFVTWNKNYGVDFVGDIEVRWKIEPSYAERKESSSGVAHPIGNPTPNGTPDAGTAGGAPADSVTNNGTFYIYRVAGEARYNSGIQHDAESSTRDQINRTVTTENRLVKAQGARYVVTPNKSALNYLLFYALRGPKADLELSHGPTVQLIGDVYTGGAAYWGSGTVCNDWLALKPTNGNTILGPPSTVTAWSAGTNYTVGQLASSGGSVYQCKAAHTATTALQPGSGSGWMALWQNVTTCKMVAIDGAYRLSKQLLYGAINGYPMQSIPPSGFSLASCLNLDPDHLGAPFPGENAGNTAKASYKIPDASASNVYDATYQGTVINPARANDVFATRPLSGSDTQRLVNVNTGTGITSVYLRGVDEGASPAIGNDSRDRTRASSVGFVWKSGSVQPSAPGFKRQIMTSDNGATPEDPTAAFIGRQEEPQQLRYFELDGDPTTDEHEYAMPLFLDNAGGHTVDLAQRRQNTAAGIDAIEVPGSYMEEALGKGLYLGRKTNYTGWTVVDASGTPTLTESSNGQGLVIRERPVPDTTYFLPAALPSPSDPYYMPLCYGHIRTSSWPFTACNVMGYDSDLWNGSPLGYTTTSLASQPNRFTGINSAVESQRYLGGGLLNFRSSCDPGPSYSGGWYDSTSLYQRFPYYHQDNWRFMALSKALPLTTGTPPQGLRGYYFNDKPNSSSQYLGPFGGRMVFSRLDPTIDFLGWNGVVPAGTTGLASTYYSVRWTGLVKAEYNDNYQFICSNGSDDGVRLWVDGKLILDSWFYVSGDRTSISIPMVRGQWVPIVLEMYQLTGGSGIKLEWMSGSQARQTVPADHLQPPASQAYDWSTFTSTEMALNPSDFKQGLSSVTNGKVGLMLRAGAGLSPMQSGRDPYVALCFSPTRGVFAQVRGERAIAAQGTRGSNFIGHGTDGAGGSVITDGTTGEIAMAPNLTASPNVTRLATLTPVFASSVIGTGSGYSSTTTYTPSSWSTSSFTYDTSPGALPEGTVDKIAVGPVTTRTVVQPTARNYTTITTRWYYRLGDTASSTQVFIPNNTTPNDGGQRLFLYPDASGDRSVDGTYSGNSSRLTLTTSTSTTAYPNVNQAIVGVAPIGTLITNEASSSSGTGYSNWGTPGDSGNVVVGDATTIWYLTSPDTRPKIYSGSTFVRYLTSSEAQALLKAKTGLTYTVKTTVPPYPTITATPDAGYPAATAPTMPGINYPGTTRLSALTTAPVAGTLQTWTIGTNRPFAVDDVLQVNSEQVKVTAVPATTTTITVQRGWNGTTPVAWPANTLISSTRVPYSVLRATNVTASTTDTLWSVVTTANIVVGDYLQIDSEHVQVTAIDATARTITVVRQRNGTALAAHTANTAAITSIAPLMTKLTTAITSTTATTLAVASTAGLAVNKVVRIDDELIKITAIPSATSLTVTRGFARSTPATHAINSLIQATVPRPFSLNRGRTVTFDLHSWITAGAAPSTTWRSTHPQDDGWYWGGVSSGAAYSALLNLVPWKSFWGAVSPLPRTGSIQPRVFDSAWTGAMPPTVQPTTNMPTSPDTAFPGGTNIAALSGRYLDDQPAAWVSGTSYSAGSVVFAGNALYRAKSAHTSASATQPTSGASWSTVWESAKVWLRIEKVATAPTQVRFLYAVSSTTPASSDWRPVLVTPNTAAASAPLPGNTGSTDAARELRVDIDRWFRSAYTVTTAAVATAATGATTTIPVTTGTGATFSVGDLVQIDDERMMVTATGASSITVSRNYGGNLASSGTSMAHASGVAIVRSAYRGPDLLIGVCAQSGAYYNSASSGSVLDTTISDLKVNTSSGVIDSTTWDSSGGSSAADTTNYLCSQYQVFWGPYDITEDFFTYGQSSTTTRCADENWFYNQREFWSQSRWWDDGQDKDPTYVLPSSKTTPSMREIYAKTTLLSLNLRAIQDYLTTRSLSQATADVIPGAGPTAPIIGADYTLSQHITKDGLRIHASRYNRYPWNPNLNGANPWNPNLPNATSGLYSNTSLAALATDADRQTAFNAGRASRVAVNCSNSLTSATFPALMPFTLASAPYPAGSLWRAPAIKPQEYHHGVRILNGSSIDWGFTGSGDLFGASKTTLVTPNALYIQGDLNTIAHPVTDRGVTVNKMTPLGVYCDSATFLSNGWTDVSMQDPGLTVSTTAVTDGGALAKGQVAGASYAIPVANASPLPTTTTYACALITHNQPTNKNTVRMGESSSFINTMLFQEDWAGKNCVFIGSIVVMDTRRYTKAYLLDSTKTAGLGPMGWMTLSSSNPTAWTSTYASVWPYPAASGTSGTPSTSNTWAGAVLQIYGAPNRSLFYNPDFKTKEGTPPQMPFGVQATGLGGFLKIVN